MERYTGRDEHETNITYYSGKTIGGTPTTKTEKTRLCRKPEGIPSELIEEIKARLKRGEYYVPYAPQDISALVAEVERLGEENRALRDTIDKMMKQNKRIISSNAAKDGEIDTLKRELAESRRREKAAIDDLRESNEKSGDCTYCKHRTDYGGCGDGAQNRFEWRGPEAEKGETEDRRPAPENKPLTLEELRQMDEKSAYIQFGDGAEGNAILNWDGESLYLYGFDDHSEPDLDFYNMTYNDPDGHFGLHLLGWRALRHKPGAETECKKNE